MVAIQILIGIICGTAIASAVSSFLMLIGLVHKLATRTSTTRGMKLYRCMICLGFIMGVLLAVKEPVIALGEIVGVIVSGIIGMYVGTVALLLAESLKVLPILIKKINLTIGTKLIIFTMAIGKALGSLLYYLKIG